MTVLICFDWDGTLADSWPVYEKAAHAYCTRKNIPCPDDDVLRHAFGNTLWEGLPEWGDTFEEQDAHRFGIYDEFYRLLRDPENRLAVPFAAYCLEQSLKANFTLAVVTSRWRMPLLQALDHHQWSSFFKHTVTRNCAAELGLRDKPHPDMIEHLLAKTGTDRRKTVMVGDTRMDVEMAHNAGVHSIAVGWGMGQEDRLKALRPTRFCNDPARLWGTICDLNL